jgi:hypothetical protein
MPDHFPGVNRRLILAFAAAGFPASQAASQTPAHGVRGDALPWFIKMRGALDDRLTIGFLSGRYDGFVDGERTPLFGLFSATFSRYRANKDGYEVFGFEQAYFTDLKTQEVLRQFTNPYTGEVVDVPVTSSSPSELSVSSDLRFHSSNKLPANVKLDMFASPPEFIGNEVFFVEQLYASRDPEGNTPRFSYTENTTLRSKVADVKRTNTASAPCQTSFDAVVSWRPWLKMGDRPGCMTAFGHGSYGVDLTELPRPWLDATTKIRPELLSNPAAVLDPLWSKRE